MRISLPLSVSILRTIYGKEEVPSIRALTVVGGFFLVLGIGGLGTILFGPGFGGLLGTSLAKPLVTHFAYYPSVFLLAGISVIGSIIFLERKPSLEPIKVLTSYPFEKLLSFFSSRKGKSFDDEDHLPMPKVTEEEELGIPGDHGNFWRHNI